MNKELFRQLCMDEQVSYVEFSFKIGGEKIYCTYHNDNDNNKPYLKVHYMEELDIVNIKNPDDAYAKIFSFIRQQIEIAKRRYSDKLTAVCNASNALHAYEEHKDEDNRDKTT